MIEGRSRDWLAAADGRDIEAVRWQLYAAALGDMATAPYAEMRESAEIELIENPKTQVSKARAFNKRRIEGLIQAEIAKSAVREALLLDDDDAE